ncbi:hypothetical protein GF312_01510, partial [Candidatus Poribacteria bacterium]|nr:hypothetical protein [Candidatus Poribacteria bacterium]
MYKKLLIHIFIIAAIALIIITSAADRSEDLMFRQVMQYYTGSGTYS